MIGNFGGAFAANIYRTQDAPRYIIGRKPFPQFSLDSSLKIGADAIELMFVGIGFITLPLVVYLYKRINAKREREMGQVQYTEKELKEMGDRAPEFRYTI